MNKIMEEEGVPTVDYLNNKYGVVNVREYSPSSSASTNKVFDPAEQLARDPLGKILNNADKILQNDNFLIGCHPGYIDDELLGLTTLSLERCKDAAMWMSPELKKFVEDNNVELIKYTYLY